MKREREKEGKRKRKREEKVCVYMLGNGDLRDTVE